MLPLTNAKDATLYSIHRKNLFNMKSTPNIEGQALAGNSKLKEILRRIKIYR
jgi:hypothetical protein